MFSYSCPPVSILFINIESLSVGYISPIDVFINLYITFPRNIALL